MALQPLGFWPWRVAFAVALVVTLWLALRPVPPGVPLFAHADKVGHALAFTLLGWLGARSGLPRWPLAIGLLAYGGAIELLQGLTSTREPSWADWAADAAGVALGVWGGARSSGGRAPGAPG